MIEVMSPMQSDTTVSFGLWIVQLTVANFFIAGFVELFNTIWRQAFQPDDLPPAIKRRRRRTWLLLPIIVGGVMQYGGLISGRNTAMFINISLFVLVIPLLARNNTTVTYLFRCAILLGVWQLTHLTNWFLAPSIAGNGVLLLMMLLIGHYTDEIRYHWLPAMATWLTIALAFWLTIPDHVYHVPMTPLLRGQAITIFLAMGSLATSYWIRRQQELIQTQKIQQLADYDSLTNAKTYSHYQRDTTGLFQEARQSHQPLTLVSLDIDRFKQVNDTFGHLAGNTVLVGVADTLKQTLESHGEQNHIYRTGGEEFNIIFPDKAIDDVLPIIEACWQAVRKSYYTSGDDQISVTISMGVTQVVTTDQSINDTYKRADSNLYQSKQRGRDAVTVNGHTLHTDHDLSTDADIHTFFTQSIMTVADGDPILWGNELLLRLYDKDREHWVLPSEFAISVEMQVALINKVLQTDVNTRLGLNLTADQFQDPHVSDVLCDFFQKTPAIPELGVEIIDVPSLDVMAEISQNYHESGITIYIDDVGSDNSYELVRDMLPYIDGIKFAMQNLRRTDSLTRIQDRIKFWVEVANTAKITFILEGVENQSELAFAQSLGIQQFQGYYFDRPSLPTRV